MNAGATKTMQRLGAVLVVAGLAGTAAMAQTVTVTRLTPNLDRWNYPFGDFQGIRSSAPTFTTNGVTGFDDRDAEVLIGFNTGPDVPTGMPLSHYNVQSLTVRLTVTVPDASAAFVYDPTQDPFQSYFASSDPFFIADADAGRPVELYACGYRPTSPAPGAPLWSALTFQENSPFSSAAPNPPPARNNRNVFPVAFNELGQAVNVSNNVTGSAAEGGRFEVAPLAVGTTTAVQPGEQVIEGATFTFSVNLALPGVREYVQRALAMGRLNLLVSSLHASQQPGGAPVPINYPVFYTKENPFGAPAQLDLVVNLGGMECLADVTGIGGPPAIPDGLVTGDDFNAFIAAFAADDLLADVTGIGGPPAMPDGLITGDDFNAFIGAFAAGCP